MKNPSVLGFLLEKSAILCDLSKIALKLAQVGLLEDKDSLLRFSEGLTG